MKPDTKRTWAEISLEQLLRNLRLIRETLPPGTKFLGVVKADAYGHGALRVSRALEENGADYLAVSCLDEALELRQGGVGLPILILGHTPADYVPELLEYRLTQTVSNLAKAREYDAAARALGARLRVHIKLDTGMGRLGFLCAGPMREQGARNVSAACRLSGLDPEGIYTHFSMSDEPGSEAEAYTRNQLRLFREMLAALEEEGIRFHLRHCANTGAVANYPETAFDMVRPGLLLYGYGGSPSLPALRPCMRLLTRVTSIKHVPAGTKISYGGSWTAPGGNRMGVIGAGYADGLFRSLSGRCAFAVPGGMAPQRGRICMDMCMLDLTGLPEAEVGSPVELFGEQVRLEHLAELAGTIPYELLCAVSKRVPRVYTDWITP